MIVFLKVIHFLALAVGVGGGAANAVIGARAGKADPAVRPVLGGISGTIGLMSAAALALLWISGIALVYTAHGGWGDLPMAFWVKIGFVVVLTLVSARANMLAAAARRAGTPPPMATMKRLGQGAMLCSLIIIISAVIAFTI